MVWHAVYEITVWSKISFLIELHHLTVYLDYRQNFLTFKTISISRTSHIHPFYLSVSLKLVSCYRGLTTVHSLLISSLSLLPITSSVLDDFTKKIFSHLSYLQTYRSHHSPQLHLSLGFGHGHINYTHTQLTESHDHSDNGGGRR